MKFKLYTNFKLFQLFSCNIFRTFKFSTACWGFRLIKHGLHIWVSKYEHKHHNLFSYSMLLKILENNKFRYLFFRRLFTVIIWLLLFIIFIFCIDFRKLFTLIEHCTRLKFEPIRTIFELLWNLEIYNLFLSHKTRSESLFL